MTSATRFRSDASGTAAVEFALVGSALAFLLVTIIQLGISYMQTSAVQSGAFLLARSLMTQTVRPADSGEARAIVLRTNMLMQKRGDVIVSVTPLPTTAMTDLPAVPTEDSYSLPGPGEAVLVRVVARRTSLLPVKTYLPSFWDDLLSTQIDYSIVATLPNG